MKDERKTKSQLLEEMEALRRRVAELEASDREIKRAETALRHSESLYRTLVETVPYGIEDCDASGTILYANRAFHRMLAYAPGELIGKSVWHMLANEAEKAKLRDYIRHLAEHQAPPVPYVSVDRAKDGRLVHIQVDWDYKRDGQGAVVGFIAVVTDVTEKRRAEAKLRKAHEELEDRVRQRTAELEAANAELKEEIARRKAAEAALRQSEETARALINAPTESAVLLERDGTIVTLNETAARRLGGTIEGLVGRCAFEFFPPEVAEARKAQGHEVFRAGRAMHFEEHRGGVWFDTHVYPVFDAAGNVARLAVYARDITERKVAEQAIRREQRRLRRLLDMHERARRLVAYEIHDGLSQPLSASLMHLEAALSEVPAEPAGDVLRHLQNTLELLRKTLGETRRLMSGERPIVLDERGLLIAIEHLVCAESEEAGPEIALSRDVQFERLASPLETAVFRIVQEALTNARRHSRSDRVRIGLVQQGDRLRIEIEDWGAGFDPGAVSPDRFGLDGIRERARLFDGHANIDSAPGNGTRVVVELPLVEAAAETGNPAGDAPPRAESC